MTLRRTTTRRRPLLLVLAFLLTVSLGVPLLTSQALFTSTGTTSATGTAMSTYSRTVLADSPIAYYPLDEKSGTVAYDKTPGARHASYVSDAAGTVTPGSGKSLPINSGGSASFTGGSVIASNLPVPTAVGGKATVEFWMNLSPEMTAGLPFSWDSTNTIGFESGYFGFNTGNGDYLGVPVAPLMGRPVHVVAVFGIHSSAADYAANRRLYLNGVPQTLTRFTVPGAIGQQGVRPLSSTARLSGWINHTAYRMTHGTQMSDLAFYDRELTAAQVQNHYRAAQSYANQVLQGNPVAYWKLDEPAGAATFTDFTQRGYTGTYTTGAIRGQAGLVRDGTTSVNLNGGGHSGLPVPLNSAAGAVTTVELWIDMPAAPTNTMPIQVGDFSLYSCAVCLNGAPGFGVNASSGNMRGMPWGTVGPGRHHVVFTLVNGNQVASRIWVDGTERALSTSGPMNPNPNVTTQYPTVYGGTNNMAIGGTPGYAWTARVDEVAIYNGLLPDADIVAHYRTGL